MTQPEEPAHVRPTKVRQRTPVRGGEPNPAFGTGRRAAVIVVSTSAHAGRADDTSGPLLVDWLEGYGYSVDAPQVVPDGAGVADALRHHLIETPEALRPRVLITSGGTGLAPDDTTPEATRPLLDKEATGIALALLDHGLSKLPEAAMSRGIAGSRERTFVANVPGSRGGVKDAITILGPLLPHIQAQLENIRTDGVHPPRPTAAQAAAEDARTGAGAETSLQEGTGSGAGGPAGASGTVVVEPFAGGRLTEEPLDLAAAEALVATPQTGALATFHGVVRDHDSGRDDVVGLEYSAHPDAEAILDQVVVDAAAAHPGVRLWAEHRIGELAVGDDALLVCAASGHRREAFAACADLVDLIKERVPIWKRQDYGDGGHDWVGVG